MRNWIGVFAAFALIAPVAGSAARSSEVVVASHVLGPEGPLYVDGKLYFVSWISGTLSRLDGNAVTVLNSASGCDHNGLALSKQHTFLLACSNAHGAILELDLAGRELRRWTTDSEGRRFDGGINDIVVADDGGAYATIFGLYEGTPTEIVGRIVYRAPGSDAWVQVADDLNYANGIAISRDQKTLYVDELVGNCILKFAVEADGRLTHRSNFALLNLLVPNKSENWWLGPDSLKVDSHGNLYVAQFRGGKVLKISPQGQLLHIFLIAAGDGTTNVAFGPDERDLYVSVVKDISGDHAKGSIVKIRNVR
ncbi:MAG: SMP-30/gluconolactonase/LRE family protein [Sphingomicrobium sp.]